MKVTVARLIRLKACRDQVDLFRSTFGEEVAVTEDACVQAVTAGINIEWGAENLLNANQRQAYNNAHAPLLQAYKDAQAPLWQAYEDAQAPLWQACMDAHDPLLQAYMDAQARAFFASTQSKGE